MKRRNLFGGSLTRLINRGAGCILFVLLFLCFLPGLCFSQEFTANRIGDFGNITVMEVTGNYDAKQSDGSLNVVPRQIIAKEFFKTHKDEYDFIVIFSNFNFSMPDSEAKAFYTHIKNDVRGIGKELIDLSSLYGSNGKLKGTIDMGNISGLVLDPFDPKFEDAFYVLAHEQMHCWGAFVRFKNADGSLSTALLGKDKSHWSFLLDTSASVLYGNKWQNNGNGTFTSVGANKYFSPLDLYLMGVYDRSQVPPMLLIENPAIDSSKMPEVGATISGTSRFVTIDDIIAAEGERIPDSANAQKSFKSAFIFITSPGTFKEDAIYGIENLRTGWVTRLSIQTDGHALMDVDLAQKQDLPVNPGVTPPVVTPRPTPFNINDGVAWLMARQKTDGSWQDQPQTGERDTAEVVSVLRNFSVASGNYTSGLRWLKSAQSENLDFFARKIEALVRSGEDVSAPVSTLVSRQNPDGGWGSNRRYTSTALDTSLALKALAAANYKDSTVLSKAIEYLKSKQNTDGWWGSDDGGGTVQATCGALLAFNGFRTTYGLDTQIAKGRTWLLQRQNPDGGFGNSPSTIYDTATALITLKELGAENTVVNPGLSYIRGLQSKDGSWYGSAYQTALAIQLVWNATIMPDLSVRAVDVSITPSVMTSIPVNIVVNATVSNLGQTSVSRAKIVLYDGGLSSTQKIGEQTVDFPGQSSVSITFPVTIKDGKEHVFHIVLDPENTVAESDETNNMATKTLGMNTTYDFEALSSNVTVSPNPVDIFQDVKITSKITNKGTMNAYNVQVRYYIDDAGGPIDIATETMDIQAGATVTNDVVWKASKAGQSLPVTVLVDPFNTFDEVSKENNKAVASLTVSASTDPNLVVSYKDITITPSPVLIGGSAAISVIVRNTGFSSASNIPVNFYHGVPGQGGLLLGSQTIPSLNAGESQTVGITWNNIAESGEKVIYVRIDSDNQIKEVSEDDNDAFTTLVILSLPDLAVSANSITFNPAAPKDGDTVSINVAVQNKGEQAVNNVVVRISDGSTVIGSPVIPSIAGGSQASASLSYNTTGKPGPHQINVVVDPDNTIVEFSKENNQASRTFGVQNASLWRTEPYISPNGDGVKDNTQFFFTLTTIQTVKVVVVNEKGEIVRTFSGGLLENTGAGNVIWDGKDDNGLVVADGDYRIKVLDSTGSDIGSLPVTVDNNRSPLIKAIGTKYLLHSDITCGLPFNALKWFPDESGVLFRLHNPYQDYPEYLTGIYTAAPNGEDVRRITPQEWSMLADPVYYYYIGYEDWSGGDPGYSVSPDGSKVAFILNKHKRATSWKSDLVQLWIVNSDGSHLTLIDSYDLPQTSTGISNVAWSPDGQLLLYKLSGASGNSLWISRPDGTGKMSISSNHGSIQSMKWSSDNNKIVFSAHLPGDISNTGKESIWLTSTEGNERNISAGEGYDLVELIDWLNDKKIVFSEFSYADRTTNYWSVDTGPVPTHTKIAPSGSIQVVVGPDGKNIAFIGGNNVGITDETGNSYILHKAATFFPWHVALAELKWSKDGSKLSFIDYTYEKTDNCHYYGYLVVADLKERSKKMLRISDPESVCTAPSSYHVFTKENQDWKERGILHYDSMPETKELDLTGYPKAENSGYRLRISQQGMDAANIDYAALAIDGKRHMPSKASDISKGVDVLQKLLSKDNNVIDAHNATIEFVWDNVPTDGRLSFVMHAREEDLSRRQASPFRYPKEKYYTVGIGGVAPTNADELVDEKTGTATPLFREYTRPVTGHPDGYSYGYAKIDGDYLYGLLDFTSDNTVDNGKDWAAIEVFTDHGAKTFVVNEADRKYGKALFTYTKAVNYQHMVYEFKIPLQEIGIQKDVVQIAFHAYGTAAGGGEYYSKGTLRWLPDNVSIVAEDNNGIFVVSEDTPTKTYLPAEGTLSDVSPLGRYITYSQQVNPSSVCSRGSNYKDDIWSLSSLLNLAADLNVKKEKSSVTLKGIAADLNFDGYVLEYADVKNPTVWNLVTPPSDVPVLNDIFTTWIPPHEGIFYVRLTVRDKAGNVAQTRKRVSWGLSSAITSLYKSLEIFSPNGDGVKDNVELRYTVLEPVHLEFTIHDENNNLKRTFVKDYVSGADDFITWDGKDENGRVVPDGIYMIKVFDYEFFVKVDNTPPDVNLEFFKIFNASQGIPEEEDNLHMFYDTMSSRFKIGAYLKGHVFDGNIKRWIVEYGEGDNPHEWYEYKRGEDILLERDKDGKPVLNPINDIGIISFNSEETDKHGVSWLVGKKFKITAEDTAGNKTTSVAGLLNERIVLLGWDQNWLLGAENKEVKIGKDYPVETVSIPDGMAKPALHKLVALETIRSPISVMSIQRWNPNGHEWMDIAAVTGPSSDEFNVNWDNSGMDLTGGFSVRLKAVDLEGRIHYSNPVHTEPKFDVVFDCNITSGCGIRARNYIFEELNILSFEANGVTYKTWDRTKGDYIPEGENGGFCAPSPDHLANTEFSLQMTGIGKSGKKYVSNIAYYPPDCDTKKIALELQIIHEEGDCGFISRKAMLQAIPSVEGEFFFKTLSYYLTKTEGPLLIRQIDLTKEKWGGITIDKTQMVEGQYPVKSVLEYAEKDNPAVKEIVASGTLIVDRLLPSAQITYPSSSLRLCPMKQSGDWFGIPVEGLATDNTGVWKREVFYGVGEDPQAWTAVLTRNGAKRIPLAGGGPIKGTLGVWDVTELEDGIYSLKLKVTDTTGNVSCNATSFSFDNAVDITSVNVDKPVFSPNGDGVLDSVNVIYELGESARVDVRTFRLVKIADGYDLDATPVKTFITGQQYMAGQESLAWDGTNDAGAVVPDGLYGVAVFATDACGNTNRKWIDVEVHNTPPTVAISYPKPGDPVANIVEIKGMTDDLHFKSYTLEAGQGGSPDKWQNITTGLQPVKDDVPGNNILGKWNTFGLDGQWSLRLSAIDTMGNKSETTVLVNLTQRKILIKDLSASPKLFSPNNDGKLDTAQINYEVSDACNITIEILDKDGVSRRTYTTTTPAAGIYSYTWDGKSATGMFVPDGVYQTKLTATLSVNPSITQSEIVSVATDVTAPVADIKQPLNNVYLKGDLVVAGSVSDANMMQYSFVYSGSAGSGTIDGGQQNRENHTFGIVNDLTEGNYTLTVKAKDLVENGIEQKIAFAIDKTPPQVTLDTPREGEYYGADKNVISVTGAIVEKNLERFNLRYGLGENPAQWNDLLTDTVIPTNPQLMAWKVGKNDNIPDGFYMLSFFARDKAGWTGEAKARITIDNTPPETVITSPADGDFVRAAVDVKGTAQDQNLEKYSLEISEGLCAAAYKWVTLKTGTIPVKTGLIGALHGLPADGDYCLRVSAADKSGNKSETRVHITIDTAPPAPPVLSGKIENKSNAKLTWTANIEADLAGYNLYRDGTKINAELVKDISYLDQNLKQGTYGYTIIALDLAGNESKSSNTVKLTVDFSGPDARIRLPQDGARVSGLVDIKGTASSAEDFKEYRVYIGQGATPATWTLIRTSPLPIPYGSLVSWDTISLAEDSIHSIKLEAEDLTGNVNTQQITVAIDNLPPQAPILLTATPNVSDVTLTWRTNSEPDLAGYLLYRDNQLANVSGIVVGDMRPYLIKGITYLDKGVADGKHKYYLVAMDLAQNMSDQSNTLEVNIDTRPPHALIITPQDKAKIQGKTTVRAESPDTDIASIQFQYKRIQDAAWTNLGAPVAATPYIVLADPLALGFVYGDYNLRAVATDTGGKTDPSPAYITVTYVDLTVPDAPLNLKALTAGGDVTLTWTASTEKDLDGYNLYRVVTGSKTKINASAIKTTTYNDTGLADATYTYEVTAIDSFGNESKPSNTAVARVYAPMITQPYTPAGKSVINIQGSDATAASSVVITSVPLSGSPSNVTAPADTTGAFAARTTLTPGENRITAKATDNAGNISKPSGEVVVVFNEPPAAPTGLSTQVNSLDIALLWNPNTESDLKGYNLYRDDSKVNLSVPVVSQGVLLSSSSNGAASSAFDTNSDTYWNGYANNSPAWWQINLPSMELVNHIEIHWSNDIYTGKDFEVQVWSGYAWITQAKVTGNTVQDSVFDFNPSYRTDKVRVYVTDTTDQSGEKQVRISEVGITKDALITQASHTDTVDGGVYAYKVTAVDEYGFESTFSEEVDAGAGDVAPPSAPLNLVASSLETNITLVWSANSEPDLGGYNIYRNTTLGWRKINSNPIIGTTYLDPGLSNGTYTYRVTAVDTVGNESPSSNEASATVIDLVAPSKPEIHFPTLHGLPITLLRDKTVVSGTAEPGSTVELLRDGVSLGGALALAGDRLKSFQIPSIEEWGAVSPDGKYLAYVSNGAIWLETLATGERNEIIQRGWLPQWSPEGSKITYNFLDSDYNYRVGVYDPVKGSSGPLTADTAVSEGEPFSWSFDASKIAFISNRGGTHDAWILNVESGSMIRVTNNANPIAVSLSPDGNKLAYSDGHTHYIKELIGGDMIQIDGDADPDSFAWSYDSKQLVFSANKNGNTDIFIFDMDTRAQTQITSSADNEFSPLWSPDNKNLVYAKTEQNGSYSLWIVSSQPPYQKSLLKEHVGEIRYLSWLKSGMVVYGEGAALRMLTFKGTFSLESVGLNAGENIFSVVANDAYNNTSLPSEDISVTFNPVSLPDLEVTADDILIYPANPRVGEEASITITVRNRNQIEAKNVKVDVYLWDANGNVDLVTSDTIAYIGPASEEWVILSLDTTGKTGKNQITAITDPDNMISEGSETNNRATKGFYVVDREGLFMIASLDSDRYRSQQDVGITVNLRNSGAEKTATLDVKIEDINGVQVASVSAEPVTLQYGSDKNYTFTWNTAMTLSGAYRVHAILREGAVIQAENLVAFMIVPDAAIETTLATDRAAYNSNENILVSLGFKNNGVNNIISDLKTKVHIFDSGNQELFSEDKEIKNLIPGGSITLTSTWNTGFHLPGIYNVVVETNLEGRIVSTKNKSFRINEFVNNTGNIAVVPAVIFLGSKGQADYTIKNDSNEDMNGLILHLTIIDPQTQVVLNTHEETIDLAMNASKNSTFTFSTQGYLLKTYTVLYQSVYGGMTKNIGSASFTVKDGVPPVVSPLIPAANSIINSRFDISALAADDASGVDRVEYRIDGGTWKPLSMADPSQGRYSATMTPTTSDEGKHTISIRATDKAGNASVPVSIPVTIDITPPGTPVILMPPNNSILTAEPVEIVGNAEPGASLEMSRGGTSQTVVVSPAGEFRFTGVSLNPGRNTFVFKAKDVAGNVGPSTDYAVIFRINPSCTVATDRPNYNHDETVSITSTVLNPSGKYDLLNLVARVTILDSQGAVIFTEEKQITSIPAGQAIELKSNWNTAKNPKETYTVRLEVLEGIKIISTSMTSFIINTDIAAGLSGTISATPNPVYQGLMETIIYSVTNNGNVNVTGTIEMRIVNPDTQEVKQTFEIPAILAAGTTYPANLAVPTTSLAPHNYLVLLRFFSSVMTEPKTLSSTYFEVKDGVEITITIPDAANLLVWVNGKCESGCHCSSHDMRCPDEPTPKPCIRIDLLERILATVGIAYKIVYTRDDFETEMRSPFYTDFMVLGHHRPLVNHYGEELREQVYSGKGLISSLYLKHGQCFHGDETALFGLKYFGQLPGYIHSVAIPEGPLCSATSFSARGDAIRVDADHPENIMAWIDWHEDYRCHPVPKQYPGIIANLYGHGKTLFFAFDIGETLDDNNYDTLLTILQNAFSYVHTPSNTASFHPYRAVPVMITLKNLGVALNMRIIETYPQDIKLYDPAAGEWVVANPLAFDVGLNAGETKKIAFYALTPDKTGTYTLNTDAQYMVNGGFLPYKSLNVTINVENDTTVQALTQNIITALNSIQANWHDRGKLHAALERIRRVQHRRVDSLFDMERNIFDIIKAVESLLDVSSADIANIRLMMDELLKTWEGIYNKNR